MKENTKRVITYLQEHNNVDLTAQDVATALQLDKKVIDGVFTAAIQKKGYGVRIPAEVEAEDGTHKAIKFLKLNDSGLAIDVNAPDAE